MLSLHRQFTKELKTVKRVESGKMYKLCHIFTIKNIGFGHCTLN